MFKNDRMMMILTGLVLAVFAGSMVKYGDRIVGLMSGESKVVSQDDSYSVRAGAVQILDVLSNDLVKGPIVVLTRPAFGTVELTSGNKLTYSSPPDSSGVVDFAYCVDAEGKCDPNAVKINVISVDFSQPAAGEQPAAIAETKPQPSGPEAPAVGSQTTTLAGSPEPNGSFEDAPELETLSAEMSPPSLAAPSLSELVSPDVAVAAIRQPSGGLSNAGNADQNITAQNSAAATRAAAVDPSAFQAPEMGESSNISLGGSERAIASNVAAPTGLQAASGSDANITQLERGPEALAALPLSPGAIAAEESSPVLASPDEASFAPVEIAAAQSTTSPPAQSFSAAPNASGPIALIALQGTSADGNTAGESLNVILSEPGAQSFAKALVPPPALAPASAAPSEVAILEREPRAATALDAPPLPGLEDGASVFASRAADAIPGRSPFVFLGNLPIDITRPAVAPGVVGAMPNQITAPARIFQYDIMSRFISTTRRVDETSRAAEIAALAVPSPGFGAIPAIDLSPADQPAILQASLPGTPAAPVITAPAQNSACAILLAGQEQSGAMIEIEISAPCKPGQMVTISHAGLEFSLLTDAQGLARITLPAMAPEAEITARFEDQSSGSTTISVRGMQDVMRAGVSWRGDMDLDLNAFEYGAAVGSEGHVSPLSPRDYRTSRIKGGGYLLQLGDPALERGALAEVYTIPINRNQQRGTVALSILIANPELLCGQEITAKTSRSREGRNAGVRNVRFTLPECGRIAGQIALPGALDDIRMAGR